MPDRSVARRLAQESLARGDATGWFDALYVAAEGDPARVPWADLRVNPSFASWLEKHPLEGRGRRALVIGCGLGDDAEALAERGFQVTAFDVSANAIEWCRRRYPQSRVDYVVADLLKPPAAWRANSNFVLEVYTLQVLPAELRLNAAKQLTASVAPGGILLVIARGRETADDPGAMPWPLTRDELEALAGGGLAIASFEDFFDDEDPPVRRFRVEYRRN